MERRDHSRIGRIVRVDGEGRAYRRSSSGYEGWFSVDSPHSSGDSSDPAEDKPSEHVGVMEERRLSSLGHHFVSVFSGYKHTKLCQLKIAIKNHK